MRLPIQVSIFIVRPASDGGHEYLMLHRVLPILTFWQPVTGGVESGETIEQTAARELVEETGFAPSNLVPTGFSYTFPPDEHFKDIYEIPPDEIVVHVFVSLVEAGAEPKIDPVEHDNYRWCSFVEARELLYWWDDKEAIRKAETFLRAEKGR